ncbi:MAG: hypothetical protein EOP62_14225 [Sphingomonadales bacterium]|nr:MAG: hypothetical protein EOP62_14225 [Sphingomonadales bacterium]
MAGLRLPIYLGARAQYAATWLNSMWERETPIIGNGAGLWRVTCAPTPHEASIPRGVMIWSDATIIAMAEADAGSADLLDEWIAGHRAGLISHG